MHHSLNPKSDVVRIYLSREGGRGLIGVEDTVKLAILTSGERLLGQLEGWM